MRPPGACPLSAPPDGHIRMLLRHVMIYHMQLYLIDSAEAPTAEEVEAVRAAKGKAPAPEESDESDEDAEFGVRDAMRGPCGW